MADCAHLAECPLFARFKNEGASRIWVALYCRNDPTACERFKLSQSGGKVPDTLLPNGTHLAEAKRSIPPQAR